MVFPMVGSWCSPLFLRPQEFPSTSADKKRQRLPLAPRLAALAARLLGLGPRDTPGLRLKAWRPRKGWKRYNHVSMLYVYIYIHWFTVVISLCIFIYLSIYLFIHLFIYLYIYLYIYIFIYLYIYIFICLFIYLFIYVNVCMHACMYVFMYSCIYIHVCVQCNVM